MLGFVIGSGRCGSTLVHEVLARHPRASFVSNVDDRFARCPAPLRRAAGPLYRRLPPAATVKGRLRFAPSEAYSALSREVAPLLTDPSRDLTAADVTPWLAEGLRGFFDRRGGDGTLHKFTGWPRAGLLHEVFPEARFVHIVRDGRAVAASWLRMPWWLGHRGPEGWHFGPLPPEYAAEWESRGRSYVLLAGIAWKILMDAHAEARAALPEDRWLQVRYEDVLADPRKEFARMLEFLGLDWDRGFDRGFARHAFAAERADAYRAAFTPAQLTLLDESLAAHLESLGYT